MIFILIAKIFINLLKAKLLASVKNNSFLLKKGVLSANYSAGVFKAMK